MQKSFYVNTNCCEGAFNITEEVVRIVKESGITTGIVNVFVQSATAAILVQETWSDEMQTSTLILLDKIIRNASKNLSKGFIDKNGCVHLKANILGQSKTLPIVSGKIGISIWQNIFLYEFDGPRKNRTVFVSVINSI